MLHKCYIYIFKYYIYVSFCNTRNHNLAEKSSIIYKNFSTGLAAADDAFCLYIVERYKNSHLEKAWALQRQGFPAFQKYPATGKTAANDRPAPPSRAPLCQL